MYVLSTGVDAQPTCAARESALERNTWLPCRPNEKRQCVVFLLVWAVLGCFIFYGEAILKCFAFSRWWLQKQGHPCITFIRGGRREVARTSCNSFT